MPGSSTAGAAGKPSGSPLLLRSSLRFLLRRRWHSSLTLIAVMLAVAMVVGVDLANSSARKAFALSLESISGSTTHQIIAGAGAIDETVYTRLRTERGIRSSLPLVTGTVTIDGQSFTLLGIDPISEIALGRHSAGLASGGLDRALFTDNAAMVSQRVAAQLNLQTGDSFNVSTGQQQHSLVLTSAFASANPAATEGLLFVDIALAQRLLQRYGLLDRIDLTVSDSQAQSLENWLPAGLQIVQSETRNNNLQQMSEAFHINLTAMSLLALLVAALLIYNTVTLSVIQRRKTLGIFRALGLSRRELFTLVLKETALLATVASLAGIVLGSLLGQALVHLVTRTVDDLYFNLHVSAFLFDPASLLKGFLLGLGLALLAAILPAWEASKSTPIAAMQRSSLERSHWRNLPRMGLVAALSIALGCLMLVPQQGSLIEGFVALTFIVIGCCLLVPLLLVATTCLTMRLLKPLLSSIARIAVRDISAGISRTGMAVAALTVAVSVTVGVGVMVNSFRVTVNTWLEQYLSADIYVSSSERSGSALSPALAAQLATLTGIASVSASRVTRVESQFGPLPLLALTTTASDSRLPIKQMVEGGWQRFVNGEGLMISEPLAYHRKLVPGDSVRLLTAQGERALPVLGIYYDYSSSVGMLALQRERYRALWADDHISSLSLSASPGQNLAELLQRVKSQLPTGSSAISNGEIRTVAIAVFDRTFEITGILRILAVLVAFVGVLSALMALQLERSREFAIMRATGMTPRQLATMIFAQTGLMGLMAGIFSIPLGLIMAKILIEVINERSFGWSILYQLPPGVLLEALSLALVAALLAAVYPAWRAATVAPALALREE